MESEDLVNLYNLSHFMAHKIKIVKFATNLEKREN
jgi:hypothetical protein